MINGIIFDYGGTLDSRGEHWSHVIRRAWLSAGLQVPEDTFRAAYVEAERELARNPHILPHHTFLDLLRIKIRLELQYASQPLATADEIAQSCYQSARQCIAEARPILESLAEKYPLQLVSNFYGNLEAVVRDMGIRYCFRGITESALVGVRKPDPAIFRLGVSALNLRPEEVLVVGDSLRKDILPAESIGCRVAWLKGRGWTPSDDAQTHPSAISSLHDLAFILAE